MWWARQDSNLEPTGYEPAALTVVLQGQNCEQSKESNLLPLRYERNELRMLYSAIL